MDERLFGYIFDQMPKMNPRIAEGIAVQQMRNPEAYIDRVWRCASRSFCPGLEYVDYRRCTPREEYNKLTQIRMGKQSYDLSRSDFYMVKFMFNYQGEPLLESYAMMPFVGPAGTIHIKGTEYTISPVLTDRSISIDGGKIFIPLTRDRLVFNRSSFVVNVDGVNQSLYFHWSNIYHSNASRARGSVAAETTLPLYMFCKFGLQRTFVEFLGVTPVFGLQDQINTNNYPEEHWSIFRSAGLKPYGVKRRDWRPSQLAVAIPKHDVSETVSSFIAGFFYTVESFSERVTLDDLEEVRLWKTLWGLSKFGSGESEGVLVGRVDQHLASLDEYTDDLAKSELFRDGIMCNDVYELFVYVVENMNDWIMNDPGNCMEGRRLSTLKYVMHDLTSAIFKLTYQLNPKGKVLTAKELVTRFNRGLTPELMLRINNNKHGEVSSVVAPGDSMVLKHTASIIPQTSANKGSGDDGFSFNDPAMKIHSTIPFSGSYMNLPKNHPVGITKLNLWGEVTADGELTIRPSDRELADNLQERLDK